MANFGASVATSCPGPTCPPPPPLSDMLGSPPYPLLPQWLLLQVEYLNKGECFGEVAVTKAPIAQTTAVASGMTTILLVISK